MNKNQKKVILHCHSEDNPYGIKKSWRNALTTNGQCLRYKLYLFKFLAYAIGIGLLVEIGSPHTAFSACRRYVKI